MDLQLKVSVDDVFLAEHAGAIRALGKRMISDIIEIGRRLAECKARLDHGEWLPWLEQEFGWSERTAYNFLQVHENLGAKLANFANLTIDASALYLLAAPSTPDTARDKVLSADEPLSRDEIERIVDEERLKATSETIERERARAAEREKEIRAEFEGKLVLDPADLEAELGKVTKKLERELTKAHAKIEKLTKRDDDRKKRDKARRDQEGKGELPPQRPRIDQSILLISVGVVSGLQYCVKSMSAAAPEQIIQVERDAASATGETLEQRMAEMFILAKQVQSWINHLIELEGKT